MIEPIGRWALETACAQFVAWREQGVLIEHVSVNVSPRQFRNPDLVRVVREALDASGMSAGALRLEITESAVIEDHGAAQTNLAALVELGTPLELDDFGTGYSSLAYLHRFPVHTLKVDQSFVRDIKSDRDDAAIVSTVITLARQMGLKALAEGVETEAQLAFLRSRGCDSFQGYLFCPPQPAAEIEALLIRHRASASSSARPRTRVRKKARAARV